MIGRTLGAYLSVRFLRAVVGVFAVLFGLVFILDFVETMRRAADIAGAEAGRAGGAVAAARALDPRADASLRRAVRRDGRLPGPVAPPRTGGRPRLRCLGLAVPHAARSSSRALLGIAAATVFNPVSADMKARADAQEAKIFGQAAPSRRSAGASWIRQRSVDGQAVIRATSSEDQGLVLYNVTVFAFDDEGRFKERIEAQTARLEDGYWRLAKVARPDARTSSRRAMTAIPWRPISQRRRCSRPFPPPIPCHSGDFPGQSIWPTRRVLMQTSIACNIRHFWRALRC